jgi:hypothetical protein
MVQALLYVTFSLPVKGIKEMRLAEISAVFLEHHGPGPFPGSLFHKKYKKIYQGRCRGWKWMRCVERVRYPYNRGPNRETRPPQGPPVRKGIPYSAFLFHPAPMHPLATLSYSLPICFTSHPCPPVAPTSPLLSLITWSCPCCVVGMDIRADSQLP